MKQKQRVAHAVWRTFIILKWSQFEVTFSSRSKTWNMTVQVYYSLCFNGPTAADFLFTGRFLSTLLSETHYRALRLRTISFSACSQPSDTSAWSTALRSTEYEAVFRPPAPFLEVFVSAAVQRIRRVRDGWMAHETPPLQKTRAQVLCDPAPKRT